MKIDGAGTANATGIHLRAATVTSVDVEMPLSDPDSTGFFAEGGSAVTDTTITGTVGFRHSAQNTTDTLSRVSIQAGYQGISTDGGDVAVDNAVIDLGTSSGTGLAAANFNPGTNPKAINASHVTIVGGGSNSKGVYAYAADPNALQVSTVMLDNSIVRGPAKDLVVVAGNTLGGAPSVATITTTYSDWHSKTETNTGNGTPTVAEGAGHLDVDPAFVNSAVDDYRLTAASPLVDKGNPVAGGPATDLDGHARVVDGNGDGNAVRDIGAYERPDTIAPDTGITGGPSGPTNDATPTFTFSSDPGATFECKVDSAPYAACAGPGNAHTTAPLADGAHTFFVRATDTAANVDATPAQRSFTIDTAAPGTNFTSKPAKRVMTRRVTFKFTSTEAGATFQCKLDARAWCACTSPDRFRVKVGRHHFSVRAIDAAGNTGAARTYGFRRVR